MTAHPIADRKIAVSAPAQTASAQAASAPSASAPAVARPGTVGAAAARRRGARQIMSWWQPAAVFLALVGLFYLAALYYDKVQGLSYIVPYPHLIVASLFDPIFLPQLLTNLGNTALVAVIGLAIAVVIGMAWAVLMSQAAWVERSLYPYAVVLQCIPILALTPLIGSLMGYNIQSRILVTVMIALFPIVSNTLFGLLSADKGQRELFRLQGAGRLTRLVKLQFPSALPSIFVGLRTSAGLSVIGAIVGDQFFQRGTPGLGVLIQVASARLNGSWTFATIFTASLLGVAVFVLFGLLGRLAVGRWYDSGK